jgi:prefoldin subunit 5
MTRQERVKVLRDMDAVIERTERACQEYELIQMEMMAALARAKAIHKQLLAKKAELVRELDEAGM